MEDEFRALLKRVRAELAGPAEFAAFEELLALVRAGDPGPRGDRRARRRDELATILVADEQPLWAREIAAFALGAEGDRRAFETLVLLLNYREPVRCATAARVLARLGDPRTARAAAALATNPLRTAYALHPVRLLTELRAPESVPALISTLERLLAARDHCWPVARACVEGLGALGDRRAEDVLVAARRHDRLRDVAHEALARLG
ncbi:HEAT repeat domain-containing protein [Streptomyces sp. ISL-11]|uniref:HEAT repeat domain-containing protein n=1 Tax=Streptomyces sp. ISL-11 TaxID=2819174 RepID=UPI001BE9AD8B|nr:HEAT repeat domain-containing protein [Streptomyces sp. ISL-11]MBT2383413.1 HEAT repeat domain-containing protein [Streptomyces sp. ISL-11]